MPIEQRKSRKKKKGKSFWDKLPGSKIASQTVKDLGSIAKGTPGAVAETAGAVKKDFLAGPKFVSPRNPLELARNEDKDALGEIFKASITGTQETLRHPLRNPGYTAVALLGLTPQGGLLKGTPKRPPRRSIVYKPKNKEEREFFRKAMGLPAGSAPQTVRVEIPASKRNITRAAQKAVDKARPRVSQKLQKRKVEKGISERRETVNRLTAENPRGVKQALKEIKARGVKENVKASAKHPVKELNALVRGARLYRGAYVPPNWLGAQAVNLIHSGPRGYARQIQRQHKGRKEYPGHARMIDRLMGETAAEASLDLGEGGTITELMRGVGTTLGKATDRASRNRIFREEARRSGYESEKDLAQLMMRAEQGDWRAINDLNLIRLNAERSAIKFTRTPSLSGPTTLGKIDQTLANNLFLYKWLTASTRYGGHMLGEHPTLAAALAEVGKDSTSIEDVLGEGNVPEFMENYIPRGVRDNMPLVNNPTAASLYDFPFEILNTLGRSREDIREISDIFNPVQAAGINAATGFDPFRDQEISQFADAPLDRARFGAATQLRSIPYLEWGRLNDTDEEREGRLFPLSPTDIFFRQLLGSSLHPTGFPVDPKVAAKMAKQAREKGKTKKRKRKRARESF